MHEPQSRTNAAGGAGVFLPLGLESLLPLVLDGLLEPDVKVAEAQIAAARHAPPPRRPRSLFRHQRQRQTVDGRGGFCRRRGRRTLESRHRPKGGNPDCQRCQAESRTLRCGLLPLRLRETAPATYRHRRGVAEPCPACRAGGRADHGPWRIRSRRTDAGRRPLPQRVLRPGRPPPS